MKLKLSLLLLLAVTASTFAQQKGKISGKVYDKDLREVIPYATIAVKNNEQVITGGMSDEKGNFEIPVTPNDYIVEVQFIGYQSTNQKVSLSNSQPSIDLGDIYLSPESTLLEGVNIIAEQSTIEQKIDRKVINVGRDLTTVGATASEIMNNVPSVNVDQDGKISLRGNENVRILVDGRPTNIAPDQLLKQIPSTSIKKIELITNPSAKYNPEGMSGIINIVLHKNSNNGFNGSFDTGFTFAKTVKNNNSLNLNYRTGKVNFFGSGSTSHGKYSNDGEIYRFDQDSEQLIDSYNKNNSFLYKVGMDYYINDKNTISFYTNQSRYDGKSNVVTNNLYPAGTFDDIFQKSNYDSNNRNSTYNLAYKHMFNEDGHNLDVEVNLNDSKSDSEGYFDTKIENADNYFYKDYTDDKSTLTTVNVDYVNPLNENTKLELGGEARVNRSKNHADSGNPMTPAEQANMDYNYDTDIYSLYATFGQKFNKFSYQLGTRLESYKVNSKINGETGFKDDYLTLYPSVYLGYNLSEKDMFQLSYSRRVDRPGIWQTRPIREFSTPTVTSIGNPKLKPQFTNSVELNYTRMLEKGSITAGVYYRRINDEINRVIYDDVENENPNAMIMTHDNFSSNNAYGFELSANLKLTSWWDVQPAIDFSSIQQKGLISVLNAGKNELEFMSREITANAFNARLNNNFKATNSLRFNLFGFYRGAVDGITFNSKEMYKIDAGARYALLDNKLSISLRFNDIFNTMKYSFDGEYPYPSRGEFRWESRSVYLGINYVFGGGKNRAMQRKNRDDNTKQNSGGGGLF